MRRLIGNTHHSQPITMHRNCKLIVFAILLTFAEAQTIYCGEAYECVSQELNSSSIYCKGAGSCMFSPLIISGSSTQCIGAYACFGTNMINSSGIYCKGLYGCAYVSSLEDSTYIQCDGELSCSNIDKIELNSRLYCRSHRSCSNSIIETGETDVDAYFYGHLSGYNSTIYSSNNGGTIDIFFGGISSGKNAKIICGNGDTCNVECYGNACNQLTAICKNCTSLSFDCENAQKSSLCPQGMPPNVLIFLL